MATFQFRVVGTYFGSPNTQHVPFAAGTSVTGPVSVEYDEDTPPSIQTIMDLVCTKAANGEVDNCLGFSYSTLHPCGSKDPNLYEITASYTKNPIGGHQGDLYNFRLQENLSGSSTDLVLQYYLYEVPNPDSPKSPIIQLNRAGDRIGFFESIDNIESVEYDKNKTYLIVWREVVINTSPTISSRVARRTKRSIEYFSKK
ncbi:MAG: hypothetical protein HN487_06040 [Flavobacterium sp.]|jgi:hypothetical protein|nr:hypothetical protein [Flavobacterium sp.]